MKWAGIERPQATCIIKFVVITLLLEFALVKFCLILLLQRNTQGVAYHDSSMIMKFMNVRITKKVAEGTWK